MSNADRGFEPDSGGDPSKFSQEQEPNDPGSQEASSFTGPSDHSETGSDEGGNSELPSEDEIREIIKRDEHAQRHIKQLEEELKQEREAKAELQEELQRRPTNEEITQRMRENQRNPDQEQSQQPQEGQTTPIDEETLEEKLTEVLTKKEQEKIQTENLNQCLNEAKEVYGEEYGKQVKSLAEQYGMTLKEVDQLAASRPAAFRSLFIGEKKDENAGGQEENQRSSFVPGGTQRVDPDPNAAPDESQVREIYRKNKRKFWSPETYEMIRQQKQKQQR